VGRSEARKEDPKGDRREGRTEDRRVEPLVGCSEVRQRAHWEAKMGEEEVA
jgi:hypothetical protein